MLQKISLISSRWLLRNSSYKKQTSTIYIYGFTLIYSTILIAISILLLSSFVNNITYGIVYMVFFIPIRQYSEASQQTNH